MCIYKRKASNFFLEFNYEEKEIIVNWMICTRRSKEFYGKFFVSGKGVVDLFSCLKPDGEAIKHK